MNAEGSFGAAPWGPAKTSVVLGAASGEEKADKDVSSPEKPPMSCVAAVMTPKPGAETSH